MSAAVRGPHPVAVPVLPLLSGLSRRCHRPERSGRLSPTTSTAIPMSDLRHRTRCRKRACRFQPHVWSQNSDRAAPICYSDPESSEPRRSKRVQGGGHPSRGQDGSARRHGSGRLDGPGGRTGFLRSPGEYRLAVRSRLESQQDGARRPTGVAIPLARRSSITTRNGARSCMMTATYCSCSSPRRQA